MILASSSGGSWGQWEESSFPGLWHPQNMEWLLVLSQPTSPEKRRKLGSFSTETEGRKVPATSNLCCCHLPLARVLGGGQDQGDDMDVTGKVSWPTGASEQGQRW